MFDRSEPENFDLLLDAIENYKGGTFMGVDASIKISLLEYYFVAKPTDDSGDAWTVILYVPEPMQGGPGFKVEVFNLEELERWFFEEFDSYRMYGIDDPKFFWDTAGTMRMLQLYVHNCEHVFLPGHYFDEPMNAGELAQMIGDC